MRLLNRGQLRSAALLLAFGFAAPGLADPAAPPNAEQPPTPLARPRDLPPLAAATTAGPDAEDCIDALAALGAAAQTADFGAPADPRCVIVAPVRLEAFAPKDAPRIDLPDRPMLACAAALTLGRYVEELLAPLVNGAFNAAIIAIETGPGFDCRARNRIDDAKLSAHAKGLAIDIASLKFASGQIFRIGQPGDERQRGFDRAARAGACGYFHTALGPGADPHHAMHWHFDLEPRGRDGASKYCQ